MAYQRMLNGEEKKICINIGRNIRKAREEMGLSLDNVAQILKFPKSKLSEIEQGKKVASSILIMQLAQLYDVSVAYLYSGVDMSVGEELFFDVQRVVAPLKCEMERQFSVALAKMCSVTVSGANQSQLLCDEVQNTVARFERLIQLNQDGAWLDMKGGQAFEAQINKLRHRLNESRKADNFQRRAQKELKEQAQLGLFT